MKKNDNNWFLREDLLKTITITNEEAIKRVYKKKPSLFKNYNYPENYMISEDKKINYRIIYCKCVSKNKEHSNFILGITVRLIEFEGKKWISLYASPVQMEKADYYVAMYEGYEEKYKESIEKNGFCYLNRKEEE